LIHSLARSVKSTRLVGDVGDGDAKRWVDLMREPAEKSSCLDMPPP